MELSKISEAIDSILKTDSVWTDKEYKMYCMLEEKVETYKNRSKSYIFSARDRKDIIANVAEQPWFEKSKHSSVVRSLLKNLEIVTYEYNTTFDETRLKLKISFEQFAFNVRYQRTSSSLKYLVYFENDKHKGHICYIDTTSDISKQKDMKLPEYDLIKSIVTSKTRRLENSDIIHVAVELIMYYDENQEICKANMGLNYPISLSYLASFN